MMDEVAESCGERAPARVPRVATVQIRAFLLWENQRYSPLSKWSPKGLMPTDRHAFTTPDGSDGFPSTSEATTACISQGWSWMAGADWVVDMNLDNIDEEGWTYSTDFSALQEESKGSKVKGMMHFVRRRKLQRFQCFDVKSIYSSEDLTCSFCDMQEVEKLSALFLERLCEASVAKHPSKSSCSKTMVLKNLFIQALALDALVGRESYSYENIRNKLEVFVEGVKNAWSTASSIMAKDSPEETLRKRTAELAQLYFTSDESDEIARLLIRKLDHVKAYHCDTAGCGQECVFSRETCPHTGCGMVYSRKWAYQHDLACPHKMVACERACGETVKRLRMGEHMREDCGLRTVRCALYDFGCTTEILAKDMAAHTQNAQEAHLCIVISRMKEVQDVVVGQQRRIAELEEVASRVPKLEASVSTHGRSITALTAGVAAGAVALKASEVRSTKLIGDKVNAVGEQVLENKRDITRIKVLVFPH